MSDTATELRRLAVDQDLLEVGRKAIEDALIEWRDEGRFMLRNNGFTVKHRDGTSSDIIRFGPEMGLTIALKAIADRLDGER